MEDDAYLPWHKRAVPDLTCMGNLKAKVGDPENLRNGLDRPIGEQINAWVGEPGDWVIYAFDEPERVRTDAFCI